MSDYEKLLSALDALDNINIGLALEYAPSEDEDSDIYKLYSRGINTFYCLQSFTKHYKKYLDNRKEE